MVAAMAWIGLLMRSELGRTLLDNLLLGLREAQIVRICRCKFYLNQRLSVKNLRPYLKS
jgi:hypothetical protein